MFARFRSVWLISIGWPFFLILANDIRVLDVLASYMLYQILQVFLLYNLDEFEKIRYLELEIKSGVSLARDCFWIWTHDQQVTKTQLYRYTKARPLTHNTHIEDKRMKKGTSNGNFREEFFESRREKIQNKLEWI